MFCHLLFTRRHARAFPCQGKSNMMDAITFVFGVSTRSGPLRVHRMSELIYDGNPRPRSAKVNATYSLDAEEINSLRTHEWTPKLNKVLHRLDKNGSIEDLIFSRSISNSNNSSVYRIQKVTVGREEYITVLATLNILVKNRNFAVFQREVSEIAARPPEKLAEYLEEISGSAELKGEWEILKEKKEDAENAMVAALGAKKALASESRTMKEQKDEADRYTRCKKRLDNLYLKKTLYELYWNKHDVELTSDCIGRLEAEQAECNKKLQDAEKDIRRLKKKRNALQRELGTAENKTKKQTATVSKKELVLIKLRTQNNHSKKNLNTLKRASEKMEVDAKKLSRRVKALRKDVKAADRKLNKFEERSAKERTESPQLSLSENQLEEYNRLTGVVRNKTATFQQQATRAKREKDEIEERLKYTQKMIDDLEKQRATLNTGIVQDRAKLQQFTEAIQDRKDHAEEKERELSSIRATIKQKTERSKLVGKMMIKLELELEHFKDYHHQTKQEEAMKAAIIEMQERFDGVRGTLFELCRPIDEEYTEAVTVAMGRHMEDIVVDTAHTAQKCINYLKTKRIGRASFLPLDKLRPPETQEGLRNLSGKTKLAIDLIDYDEDIEKAVQYSVANIIVCEDLNSAQRLKFTNGSHRINAKIVTMRGEVISKGGNMTGGITRGKANKASKWNNKMADEKRDSYKALRKEKAEIDASLVGVGAISRRGRRGKFAEELEATEAALKNIRNHIDFADSAKSRLAKKIASTLKQIKEVEKNLKRQRPKLQEYQSTFADAQDKENAIISEIAKTENKVFAKISNELGIENVKEFERNRLAFEEKASSERRKLKDRKSKLAASLKYEEERDLSIRKRLESVKKKYFSEKEKINEFEARIHDEENELDKAEEGLVKLDAALESCRDRMEVVNRDVKKAVLTRNTNKQLLLEKGNEVEGEQEQEKILLSRRRQILQDADLDNISILDHDSADDYSAASSQNTPSDAQFAEGAHASQAHRDEAKVNAIDFSQLDDDLKEPWDEDDNDETKEAKHNKSLRDFKDEIDEAQNELNQKMPNMKAEELYRAYFKRLKESDEDLKEKKRRATAAANSFEKVAAERTKRFMEAYNWMKGNIQEVYSKLTRDKNHESIGKAYLDLTQDVEPFNGGLKYATIAPGKLYRELSQLSGGEKTLASLALIFCFHGFRPSPFYVMDEIDAALDVMNVQRVSRYIREKALNRQRSANVTDISANNNKSCQCIVISLKHLFFSQAERLVGVLRDQEAGGSKTLTFDLAQFDH